jgi:hypothetical protein
MLDQFLVWGAAFERIAAANPSYHSPEQSTRVRVGVKRFLFSGGLNCAVLSASFA